MNPRKPIADLELEGSNRVKKALKLRERDAQKKLDPETREYLDKLVPLFAQTFHDCQRGSTIGDCDKANPAFIQLEVLFRIRRRLLQEDLPEVEQSVEDLLAEANRIGKTN